MPITFNAALISTGINPADVRLLRHQRKYVGGQTPYSLWRDDPAGFEGYQATQDPERRGYFAAPYWASFVGTPAGSTLFVGLFSVAIIGPVTPGVH